MIKLKTKTFIALSFFISFVHTTDFDNAKFDNYVRGQGVNEVLAEAQTIICALSRMGTENLAGDGSYKATIYMNECEQAAAESTTNTQGSAPSSASSSSSSSSTATAGTGEAAPEIETVFLNSGFTTNTIQSTKGWIVNDKPWDEETNREPKNILYLLGEQTATVSDENKFGNFTLRYQLATFGNTNADLPSWNQCPEDETSQEYKDSWCTDGLEEGYNYVLSITNTPPFNNDGSGAGTGGVTLHDTYNRPLAGTYNLLLSMGKWYEDSIGKPADYGQKAFRGLSIHEALHALGWNINDLQTANAVAGPFKSYTEPGKEGVSDDALWYVKPSTRSATLAKVHFDCQDESKWRGYPLMGIIEGGRDSHHNSHIFWEDVESYGIGGLITPITLALMEDLGVYLADYTKSTLPNLGAFAGCVITFLTFARAVACLPIST